MKTKTQDLSLLSQNHVQILEKEREWLRVKNASDLQEEKRIFEAKEFEKDKSIEDLKKQLGNVKDTSAQLDSQSRKYLEDARARSEAAQELRKSLEEAQRQLDDERTRSEKEKTRATTVENTVDVLKMQVTSLEEAKSEAMEERDSLADTYKQLKEENKNLEKQLEETVQRAKQWEKKLESDDETLRSKAELESRDLIQTQEQLETLTKELHELREEAQMSSMKSVGEGEDYRTLIEQWREGKNKLEEENKLFAQVNAKQMTMIESMAATVDSDVINSEKRLRLEIQRIEDQLAKVTAQAYFAKKALKKMYSNNSQALLHNPDCDEQSSLMMLAMRKKQPSARWGVLVGILGGSTRRVGIQSIDEVGMQLLEESEFKQGIPGNERSATSNE